MELRTVEGWAARHHGLVTLRAAVGELGVSRSAWYRAVASGRLELVRPGVARLWGTERTPEQRIAAVVYAIPDVIACHRSAARLWGVERPDDDPVDVLARRGRFVPRLDGVVVHQPTDRVDLAPLTRRSIRTTNVLRMLCDLGEVEPAAIGGALEHALVAGFVRPSTVWALVARHARQGRSGVPQLREALRAWPLGDKPADSVLEPKMARLLAAHGLPPAAFHVRIAGYEVDFLIEGTPVVVECDGWEYHVRDHERWERDLERDAALLAAGHPTVRVTWHRITRRASATARQIRDVVRRWAPHALPT